jgi:hypothetical protein
LVRHHEAQPGRNGWAVSHHRRPRKGPAYLHLCPPLGWSNALISTLPDEQATEFERSGGYHVFQQIINIRGRLTGWGKGKKTDFPPAIFREAIHHLVHPEWFNAALLAQIDGQEKCRLEHDLGKYVPQIPAAVLKSLESTWESMDSWEAGLGISIWHESEFRPTVVLFNRENHLSQIVAAVIHECFYGRYVMQHAIRPILYVSDIADKTLPYFLSFASNTAISNGIEDKHSNIWNRTTMNRALFCTADGLHLTFSGQSCDC